MTPTIVDNQIVYLDAMYYERGDIVVAEIPLVQNYETMAGVNMIKRIVALPGEVVKLTNQGIYINDTLLNEPYVEDIENTLLPHMETKEFILSDGEYFLVGDNREESFDSRDLGPIHMSYFQYGISLEPNPITDKINQQLLLNEMICIIVIVISCLLLKKVIVIPQKTTRPLTKEERRARKKMTQAERAVDDIKRTTDN